MNKKTAASKNKEKPWLHTEQRNGLYGDQFPLFEEMYGIYADWQIDCNINLFGKGQDPNGVNSLEDFLKKARFQLVEVFVNGRKMFTVNFGLPVVTLSKLVRLEPTGVIKEGFDGRKVDEEIYSLEKASGIPYYDILEAYWSRYDRMIMTGSDYVPDVDVIEVDPDWPTKRIIIKVVNMDGHERITSVNDLYDGDVDKHEFLLDPTPYSQEESLRMERYWSKKLGIPVLKTGEDYDDNYDFTVGLQ